MLPASVLNKEQFLFKYGICMEEMSCQCLSRVSKIAILLPDFSLIDRQYGELRISIGSDYHGGSCDVEGLFVITCEKWADETSLHSCLANVIYRGTDCACCACTSIFNPFLITILFQYSSSLVDRGNTVVKVLCHKSEGLWFVSSWCQWIFH